MTPQRWSHALFFTLCCLSLRDLQADSETQRYLRNAIHFYEVGRYDRSLGYFQAVVFQGSAHERAIARAYLKKTPLALLQNLNANPKLLSKQNHQRELLRKGIQLFNDGKYREASKAMNEVAQNGTFDQQVIARSYLDKLEMQGVTDQVLDEPEPSDAQPQVAETAESQVHFSGYVKEEAAYRISRPQNLSLLRTTGFAAMTGQWSEAISYKISGRYYYNAVFALTHQYPKSVADDERAQGTLRDTYVDISQGNWDARFGKQQIVWGEAIGQFIADVVNARDLRESVLPSFEFIRKPQWGTDVEYSKAEFHLEAVWLPIPEVDDIPRPGSEFAPALPVIPGFNLVFDPEEKPADKISNGEVGGRASYRAGGWDMSMFRFYTFDKLPVYLRSVTPDTVILRPVHPRITYDGGTVSKEINGVVVKAELAYTQGRYLATTDPAFPQGVLQKNILQYLVGVDHTFSNNVGVGVELSQQRILAYEDIIFNQKAQQTTISTNIRRSYFNDRLNPSIEVVMDFPYSDYLFHPTVNYKWASHLTSGVGLDLFGGSREGPFGQYRNHARVVLELRYDF